jgi:serine protease
MHGKEGSRASANNCDCRPYNTGNDETCAISTSGGWASISINAYSFSGTITRTADNNGQGPPPANNAPVASASGSCSDLVCSFSGAASSD